ncbi:MAG: hypothetical protein ABWY34_06805, partial [Pseudoxanthomonas sp.]
MAAAGWRWRTRPIKALPNSCELTPPSLDGSILDRLACTGNDLLAKVTHAGSARRMHQRRIAAA